jgi:hypothetical protein
MARAPPAASVTTLSVPFAVPSETGLNVTAMVQEAPTASVAPQSFVIVNGPDTVMLEIAIGPLPVLRSSRI